MLFYDPFCIYPCNCYVQFREKLSVSGIREHPNTDNAVQIELNVLSVYMWLKFILHVNGHQFLFSRNSYQRHSKQKMSIFQRWLPDFHIQSKSMTNCCVFFSSDQPVVNKRTLHVYRANTHRRPKENIFNLLHMTNFQLTMPSRVCCAYELTLQLYKHIMWKTRLITTSASRYLRLFLLIENSNQTFIAVFVTCRFDKVVATISTFFRTATVVYMVPSQEVVDSRAQKSSQIAVMVPKNKLNHHCVTWSNMAAKL